MGSRRLHSVHEFYRYPARFPPGFARAVIEAFSSPGEFVLDPFVGGGTTLVEARLTGRPALGSDINQLATFVSRAKTAVATKREIALLQDWGRVVAGLKLTGPTKRPKKWNAEGYFAGLANPDTWRIRDFLIRAMDALPRDGSDTLSLLARCSLLRTAQWALDIRQGMPTIAEFRDAVTQDVRRIAAATDEWRVAAQVADSATSTSLPRTTILQCAVPGLSSRAKALRLPPASLVLTSPPYPGVYVLYPLLLHHECTGSHDARPLFHTT